MDDDDSMMMQPDEENGLDSPKKEVDESAIMARKMKVTGDEEPNELLDKILYACINEIWQKYDDDKSGTLDKKEIKRFILSTITEMHGGSDETAESMFEDYFTQEDFDECFKKVDVDGSESITKEEMMDFVKLLAKF